MRRRRDRRTPSGSSPFCGRYRLGPLPRVRSRSLARSNSNSRGRAVGPGLPGGGPSGHARRPAGGPPSRYRGSRTPRAALSGVTTARPRRPVATPRAPAAPKPPPPIPEWRPWTLPDGKWGARYKGDIRTLPADLVGRLIQVTIKGGETWTATVLEVALRDEDFILVRHSGKP